MKNLKKSSESTDAAMIREAIGAGPDEPVNVYGPQFHRTADMPPVKAPPTGDWNLLRDKTASEMKAMGCALWSSESDKHGRVLMLFPYEWYDHIPAGFEIEVIDGEIERFDPGETDDDMRFGVLAYGIRVHQDASA